MKTDDLLWRPLKAEAGKEIQNFPNNPQRPRNKMPSCRFPFGIYKTNTNI